MHRYILGAVVTSLVFALSGTAPGEAIIGGTDDGGAHPYVGLVYTDEFLCSGSAISPTVVVTAAHCGADGSEVTFYYDINGSGTLGDQFDGGVTGTFHQYPGFCMGCGHGLPGFAANDLAVIILDASISLPRFARFPPLVR